MRITELLKVYKGEVSILIHDNEGHTLNVKGFSDEILNNAVIRSADAMGKHITYIYSMNDILRVDM